MIFIKILLKIDKDRLFVNNYIVYLRHMSETV